MAHDLRLTVARRPSPPAPFFLMPQSRSLRRPDGEGWAGSPDALTETATGRRLLSPSAGSLPPTEMSPSPDAASPETILQRGGKGHVAILP